MSPSSTLKTAITLILLLLSSFEVYSNQFIAASAEFAYQRQIYKTLVDENELGDAPASEFQQELEAYPLLPYVDYYYLLNNIEKVSVEDIKKFFSTNDNLASSSHLRKEWLLFLGEQERWNEYLEFYKPNDFFFSEHNLQAIECLYWQAKLFTENSENSDIADINYKNSITIDQEAEEAIKAFYLQASSSDEHCEPLFILLSENNLLTQEIIFDRIHLTLHEENYTLANYLSKQLDENRKKEFQQCLKLIEDPVKLKDKDFKLEDTAFNRVCIKNALKALLKNDTPLTLTLWKEQKKNYQFSQEEIDDFVYENAMSLYISDSEHFLSWLNPPENHPELNEKVLVEYIKQANWSGIISLYPELSVEERKESIWQYWYARSYIEYDNSPTIHPNAMRMLEKLSRKREYYGFLASFHLDNTPVLSKHQFPVDELSLEKIANLPGIIRAHEFYIIGDRVNATREWYFTRQNFTEEENGLLAILAYQWGWQEQAIITAARSDQIHNIDLRFPKGFAEQVNFYAAKHGIPNEWVFATIRQESAYGLNAVSSAGAMGLMQIMPQTAKVLARENHIRRFNNDELFLAHRNIQFGTYYLAKLRRQYHGNMLLASAAYNAGPSKVNEWIRRSPEMDIEMWIETIPYKETRNYVKNILTYQIIYQHLLGREMTPRHLFLPIK